MSHVQPGKKRDDPLIDEIRAIRKAISEEFDNDVDRLCAHLRELEKKHPGGIIKEDGLMVGGG